MESRVTQGGRRARFAFTGSEMDVHGGRKRGLARPNCRLAERKLGCAHWRKQPDERKTHHDPGRNPKVSR